MQRQNLNVDGKIGGKKCKVRKRECSSSSSLSLVQNYRLKRAFLMSKRRGTSTPAPMWKMLSSNSLSLENEKGGEKATEFSISARKLAANFWDINRLPSPRVKKVDLEDKMSVGIVKKERILESFKLVSMAFRSSDRFRSPVSERIDPPKVLKKLLQAGDNLGCSNSLHNYLVEVDHTQNHAPSPCKHITATKNPLKDVYNGLTTSKELLKVMSHISRHEQQNSTCLSLVSALKFELDRACIQIKKVVQEQREIDFSLKQFEEEKMVRKLKEQDRIHSTITSISRELEIEKKLRRQTDRLNKNLGSELEETKATLSGVTKDLEDEKRAREVLEQVCEELTNGVGEDKAEVEKLKKESQKLREEVAKEREMLQLADLIREERVQMKLSEAKYQYEEKNALVDKLMNELEASLKSKKSEEEVDASPNYDKIKELERYLKETLPISYQYQDIKKEDNNEAANKEDDEEEDDDDDDDDSADSELHSIELNVDNISKSFQWKNAVKNESTRNSVDKSKERKSFLEITKKPTISSETKWEFTTNNQENLDVLNRRGLFEFASKSFKGGIEDDMERYNMIKDLREHIIVSGSKIASSQDLANQKSVSSNGYNGVVCQG